MIILGKKQKCSNIKQFLRRNIHFFIFYDHLFKTSYGRKTAKNTVFRKYLIFSRLDISETVHPTKKVKIPCIASFFSSCSSCPQKSPTMIGKCFSRALVFFNLTSFFRVTGRKLKKDFSVFIQNFLPVTIEIKPKLLEKVLDGNVYFPVYFTQ